jgi:hypothetical protein
MTIRPMVVLLSPSPMKPAGREKTREPRAAKPEELVPVHTEDPLLMIELFRRLRG